MSSHHNDYSNAAILKSVRQKGINMNNIYSRLNFKFVGIFIVCSCLPIYAAQSESSEDNNDSLPSRHTDLYSYIKEMIKRHNEETEAGVTDIHSHVNKLLEQHDQERHKSHHSVTEHIHKGDIHKEGSHVQKK